MNIKFKRILKFKFRELRFNYNELGRLHFLSEMINREINI